MPIQQTLFSYSIEQKVLIQNNVSNHKLKQSKITEIVYEEFDLYIDKGYKLKENFTEIHFENDKLYYVKIWKPFYKIEDGAIIKYEHQIFELC